MDLRNCLSWWIRQPRVKHLDTTCLAHRPRADGFRDQPVPFTDSVIGMIATITRPLTEPSLQRLTDERTSCLSFLAPHAIQIQMGTLSKLANPVPNRSGRLHFPSDGIADESGAARGKNKQGRDNLRKVRYALFCTIDGQLRPVDNARFRSCSGANEVALSHSTIAWPEPCPTKMRTYSAPGRSRDFPHSETVRSGLSPGNEGRRRPGPRAPRRQSGMRERQGRGRER
jgi:hypothetical protein